MKQDGSEKENESEPCKSGGTPKSGAVRYYLGKDIPADEALALYRIAGWFKPDDSGKEMQSMIANSFVISAAFDEKDGRLIGMFRALSDGVSDAYLLDLIVSPERRKEGIGSALVKQMTLYLSRLGIDWIVCIGAPGTEPFYRCQVGAKCMDGYVPFRFDATGESGEEMR